MAKSTPETMEFCVNEANLYGRNEAVILTLIRQFSTNCKNEETLNFWGDWYFIISEEVKIKIATHLPHLSSDRIADAFAVFEKTTAFKYITTDIKNTESRIMVFNKEYDVYEVYMKKPTIAHARAQRTGNPHNKLVLMLLANFAGDYSKACLNVDLQTLAQMGEMNAATLDKCLTELIEQNLIGKCIETDKNRLEGSFSCLLMFDNWHSKLDHLTSVNAGEADG